jgi:hypothetical protein
MTALAVTLCSSRCRASTSSRTIVRVAKALCCAPASSSIDGRVLRSCRPRCIIDGPVAVAEARARAVAELDNYGAAQASTAPRFRCCCSCAPRSAATQLLLCKVARLLAFHMNTVGPDEASRADDREHCQQSAAAGAVAGADQRRRGVRGVGRRFAACRTRRDTASTADGAPRTRSSSR